MSVGWVLVGTMAQGMLAAVLWLTLVMLHGGPDRHLGKAQAWMLDTSFYWLPAFPIISAVVVIFLYVTGGGSASYWWYLLPVGPIFLAAKFFDN